MLTEEEQEWAIQDGEDPEQYWDPDYALDSCEGDEGAEEEGEQETKELGQEESLPVDSNVGLLQICSLQIKPIRSVEIKKTSTDQLWSYIDSLLQDTTTKAVKADVLWDSGATHALLPGSQLSMIPEKDRYKGQLALIGLAAGRKHTGYILDDLVFTTGVAECILPAGRVVDKLGLIVYHSPEKCCC